MTMTPKAELEAEVARLKERVAELEGAVEAYKFALEHASKKDVPSIPYNPYYPVTPYSFPYTQPKVTWVNKTPDDVFVTYNDQYSHLPPSSDS